MKRCDFISSTVSGSMGLTLGASVLPSASFRGSVKETPEFISIIYEFDDFTMTCDSGIATGYIKKLPVISGWIKHFSLIGGQMQQGQKYTELGD